MNADDIAKLPTPRTDAIRKQLFDKFPTSALDTGNNQLLLYIEAAEEYGQECAELERELAASQAKVAELLAIIKSIQEEYKLCRTLLLDRTSDVTDRDDALLTLRADLAMRDAELAAAREESTKAWDAFKRLRRAYAMIRYPTLTEEIQLLYDQHDAALSPPPQPERRSGKERRINTLHVWAMLDCNRTDERIATTYRRKVAP